MKNKSLDLAEIKKEALDFLKSQKVAVIATAFNGEPYAATMYYSVDDDFNFYFLTRSDTSKFLNNLDNSRTAIVIGFGPKHITVQACGSAAGVEVDPHNLIGKFKELQEREGFAGWPVNLVEEYKERKLFGFKLVPMTLTFLNLDDERYPSSRGPKFHLVM